MKKMMTLVTAAALLFTTTAFATGGEETVTVKVRQAFSKDFAGALKVNWEAKENYYFAEFMLNNTRFSAAYDEDGQLVATSRVIKTDQLPLALTQVLNDRYNGYEQARTATEVTHEGQTSYYLSVANDKQVLYLKAGPNGDISVEKKMRR